MTETKLSVRGGRSRKSKGDFPDKPHEVAANDLAAAVWDRVLPELTAQGSIVKVDAEILASYCLAVAHWLRSEQVIAEIGVVVTIRDDKGVVKASFIAPHVQLSIRMRDQMRKYADLLGIGAASRSRMGLDLAPSDPAKATGLEALLRSTAG